MESVSSRERSVRVDWPGCCRQSMDAPCRGVIRKPHSAAHGQCDEICGLNHYGALDQPLQT